MTFEQFQASRRAMSIPRHAELSGMDPDSYIGDSVLLYVDSFYIEVLTNRRFHLLIDENETTSTDLALLEKALWEWAMLEWPSAMGANTERAKLAAAYVAIVGYDPFSDGNYIDDSRSL